MRDILATLEHTKLFISVNAICIGHSSNNLSRKNLPFILVIMATLFLQLLLWANPMLEIYLEFQRQLHKSSIRETNIHKSKRFRNQSK